MVRKGEYKQEVSYSNLLTYIKQKKKNLAISMSSLIDHVTDDCRGRYGSVGINEWTVSEKFGV